MADIAALKPQWQLILGLLPSMNTCIIAVVAAGVTLGSTLVTQKIMAPAKTEITKVSAEAGTSELMHRLTLLEGDMKLVADWVAAQQAKVPGRLAPVKAAPAVVKK